MSDVVNEDSQEMKILIWRVLTEAKLAFQMSQITFSKKSTSDAIVNPKEMSISSHHVSDTRYMHGFDVVRGLAYRPASFRTSSADPSRYGTNRPPNVQ